MAVTATPIFIQAANVAEDTFVNADGTTPATICTAGANGSKVFAINVCSDDTSAVVMQVFVNDGATSYLLGTVNVPTLSGTDGSAAAVNLLDTGMIPGLDSDGELFLPSGHTLLVAPTAAVTAAKTVTVICLAGDY